MSDPHATWAANHTPPLRPGVLTEQVNLLRQLERARVTYLREYHELPADGPADGAPRRLRNAASKADEYVYYMFDGPKKVWTRISEAEFELELERHLAARMYDYSLGPYARAR